MIVLKVRSSRSVSSIVLTKQEMERLNFKEGDKVLLTEAPGGYRLTQMRSRNGTSDASRGEDDAR